MNKNTFLLFTGLLFFSFVDAQTFTWNPEFFNEDENVTLTVSNFDPVAEWGVSDIYLWAWHFDSSGNQINNPDAIGFDFGNSPETAKFTNNGDGTYTFDFGLPQDFFDNTGISSIGYLIKSQDGSNQTGDNFKDVGRVVVEIISPNTDFAFVNSGDNLTVTSIINFQGSTTVQGAFEIYFNDVLVDSGNCSFPNCNGEVSNITENGTIRVVGTPPAPNDTESAEAFLEVIVVPTVIEENLPVNLVDGINYSSDNTRATLVLTAPDKEFIAVAASWNNYNPTNADIMKRDPNTGKYWLEITGLTPGQDEIYQYWVFDTDETAGANPFVVVADPFSTLILDPFNDQFIPASTFPNLPTYPAGQEGFMTVLKTGQAPYNWQVPNFVKPKKEDLIIYELLVRDFDADRNYQDLIDRIDYFKNLNINAIQLMPVMEFNGNLSWGYNTSFHMALDKTYGSPEKFKELVDVFHQNGIAVILDIALNHADFPSAQVAMWFDNTTGKPTSNSPYFNEDAQHSYSVFYDYNHQLDLTQEYVRRVIKQWIEEYKIDGFRWDLTKGFTQNCTASNETCTNNYQQDRIDILKEYADYSWLLDDTHYVIFEHLGTDNEEKEWANYRLDEGKGIMMWGKMTDPYNELTMGQNGNKDITRIGHNAHTGFNGPRVVGYPESHDEERLMYKNIAFGNASNPAHDVTDLNIALSRMSALGAVSVMVPGPKMLWHFGDLGMDNSIWTCSDGSVDIGNDGCKLDTKPQPQWVENWLGDALRRQIYDDWSKLHKLKIEEPVFEGDYTITSSSSNYTPRIEVFDTGIPTTELRHVIVLANFDVTTQNINTNFPGGLTSTWYDLMDATGNTTVSNSTASISIAPGQFRILGNRPSNVLSVDENDIYNFSVYPNPTQTEFSINTNVSHVEIYDLTGKQVKSFHGTFSRTDTFNISSLNTGMYIVKVKNDNNQTMTTKLVKL
ncbi:alpha-amylase family glycosyl hydrolase [Winogradskyella aurantia]|uniref:Alpha-amylase n=1 Tax=Winogradskyella aurantia TaxID=1915063 RepID=A0A265UVK8_9FLAO|nr:alpha-amylase family glycosyl hydrolase [Winogradskyella aurantia]OZV69349.1 alpha-amylase [Winogradskyella aurantia]